MPRDGITFEDNSDEVLKAFEDAWSRGLERIGLQAEGYAKDLVPADTGLLRNSITHAISGEAPAVKSYRADNPKPGRKNSGSYSGTAPKEEGGLSVYIGTNVEYAA